MLPVGFEPAISAGERPRTYALDRAATGFGLNYYYYYYYYLLIFYNFYSKIKNVEREE